MLPKILVSACLLGSPVRYNGSAKTVAHALLDQWQREGRLVPVCPEVAGGFGVPRPPAEIAAAACGAAVLAGTARVIDVRGMDVTSHFVDGAQAALELALAHDCRFALLTDASPSCGSHAIYDGSFAGRKHAGAGVTTALLRQHGIEVFAETEIDALEARLARFNAQARVSRTRP
ncbi:conserved hypothetical protein [Paraburkholderia unamae]|uniref:DUF523 domain-containing protein n=1 Tax=Paraburkholderia unamae TaxID=219649 RepID=UPI000DC42FB5|nr:DUF523 domain-containing protein [Paraburkholderia unamae]RAR58355.1 uncharacterized protein YbbK (DUF523 family) [Paraburkholderia unamae]CAG9271029.1 conserved hypothetical protein [Paraburkholderia unamae]